MRPQNPRHAFISTTVILLIAIFCGLLAGCAGMRHAKMPPLPDNLPSVMELTAVPFYPQEDYQCGPAALAMALSAGGLPVRPEDVADAVYTPSRKGSLQTAMIAAARRHGRLAYKISGIDALFAEISAGYPVIVLQNLGVSWYPLWHYAVAVGYDMGKRDIILRSGVDFRKTMPFGVFEKTWARGSHWGLLVLRPTQLPATAREASFLAAAAGLERTRRHQDAVLAYTTASKKWPESYGARMGLGNSYYALGNKIFHYIAAGVPIAVSDQPERRRIVQKYGVGIVFDASDPQDIARKIRHVLQDPQSCQQMRQRARQAHLTELNWEKEAQKLCQVYQELEAK